MYDFEEELSYDGNIPEPFRGVQQCLDSFVEVNYETALGLVSLPQSTEAEILHYKSKVLDIYVTIHHYQLCQNIFGMGERIISGKVTFMMI